MGLRQDIRDALGRIGADLEDGIRSVTGQSDAALLKLGRLQEGVTALDRRVAEFAEGETARLRARVTDLEGRVADLERENSALRAMIPAPVAAPLSSGGHGLPAEDGAVIKPARTGRPKTATKGPAA